MTRIATTARYQRRPDLVLRKVGEEYVVVPVRARRDELDNLFALNPVAGAIVELLTEATSYDELVHQLVERFEVSSETLNQDLAEFLPSLTELGIIEVVG